jgi:hypothetical protein
VTEGTVTELPPSLQGEQQQEQSQQKASEADVDRYVDRVSDEVLACRERGRHLFPSTREVGITFTGLDDDGLLLRRLTCTCCGLAVKVERWEGRRRGRQNRFERVGSRLEYRTGREGQTYLAPSGRGHMTPRQIGDSIASKALAGQSLAALRKAARRSGNTGADSSNEQHAGHTPTTGDTSGDEASEANAAPLAATGSTPGGAEPPTTITVDDQSYGIRPTAEPGVFTVTVDGALIGTVRRRVSASGKTVTWEPWTADPDPPILGQVQPSRAKAVRVVIDQQQRSAGFTDG